jgi:hypothetical protein
VGQVPTLGGKHRRLHLRLDTVTGANTKPKSTANPTVQAGALQKVNSL